MKKILTLIITISMIFTLSAPLITEAKVGDVIGTAYHTDIVAYINHYAIPSYAVNGTSVIVAEDLRNFGFDVVWNQNLRSLTISRNSSIYPKQMDFSKIGKSGSKFANLLSTDITVYAKGIKLKSYAINGYTMIPIESLTMFGTCSWVPEQRAVKLWVDGLHIRSSMQQISKTGNTSSTTGTTTNNIVTAKKYSSSKLGNVTGMVTWQYNKFIGTKPDTGAKVLLMQTNHVPTSKDGSNFLLFSSFNDDLMYSTEVDGSGNYYFDNIPVGEYYLLILGDNTNESPQIQNLNISSAKNYLTNKISDEAMKRLETNIKLHSFEIKKITVSANQTYRYSVDWGYTYF